MFGITERLRTAATAGGLMAVTGALALMGLIWITFAAFTALAAYVPPAIAMLIVGVALIAPLVIALLQRRAPDKAKPEPVAEAPPAGEIAALAKLVSSAQTLSEKSPLASAALALGAAYVASRSAATSPIAIQILAEVIDQWANSKASSTPPAHASNPPEPDTDDPSI